MKVELSQPQGQLKVDYSAINRVIGEPTVSILAEIPECLHEALQRYLELHPNHDQDWAFTTALALFLLQNGNSATPEDSTHYRKAARVYLDQLFGGHPQCK